MDILISNRKWYLLYPFDLWTIRWEMAIASVLLISCFLSPIDMAFPDIQNNYFGFNFILIVMDVLFGI